MSERQAPYPPEPLTVGETALTVGKEQQLHRCQLKGQGSLKNRGEAMLHHLVRGMTLAKGALAF